MRSSAVTAMTSLAFLGACGSEVSISERTEADRHNGYTHTAFTNVSVFRMSDPNAGREKVGRKAIEFCGLPSGTAFDAIRLSDGGGIYDARLFAFTCPNWERN